MAAVVFDIEDVGGITDFEEPYTGKVNVANDPGAAISGFEEDPIFSRGNSWVIALVGTGTSKKR